MFCIFPIQSHVNSNPQSWRMSAIHMGASFSTYYKIKSMTIFLILLKGKQEAGSGPAACYHFPPLLRTHRGWDFSVWKLSKSLVVTFNIKKKRKKKKKRWWIDSKIVRLRVRSTPGDAWKGSNCLFLFFFSSHLRGKMNKKGSNTGGLTINYYYI